MTPPMDPETWLNTFQELLRYYLRPPENTPLVNVASLAAVAAGLFLVVRSWKFERMVVSLVGLGVGAFLGYWVSLFVGTPEPISAAVGAVVMTVVAYRTYRWWLAGGSVVVLFCLALLFQLGRGDLQRYVPDLTEGGSRIINGDLIDPLVSPEVQRANLKQSWRDVAGTLKTPVVEELKALGPVGWCLPVAAAIAGGLLAYWVLKAFSVIWLGLLGSVMVLLGASTLLCVYWPDVRTWLISEPQYPAGFMIGLWLLGLVVQAKEARIPKKPPPGGENASDSSES